MNNVANNIAVIICTRNRQGKILATLKSILNNNSYGIEIIVVDQSDNNETKDALQPYFEQIKYFKSNTVGLSKARNIGVRNSSSNYIIMTDDDCVVAKNFLEAFRKAFSEFPAAKLIFGSVLPCKHDPLKGFVPSYILDKPFISRNIFEKYKTEGIGACMGYHKELWEDLGGFDEKLGAGSEFYSGEETDFAIRTILNKNHIWETPDISVIHNKIIYYGSNIKITSHYWYGTGVAFGKLLKLFPIPVTVLLLLLGQRWVFSNSRVASSIGKKSFALLRLYKFTGGLLKGFTLPVCRKTCQFR